MEFEIGLKKRFWQYCASKKVSKSEMAKHLGMTHQGISKWFDTNANTGMPTLKALNYLSEEYGLDTNWLINGGDINPDKKENNDCYKCDVVSVLTDTNAKLTQIIMDSANQARG